MLIRVFSVYLTFGKVPSFDFLRHFSKKNNKLLVPHGLTGMFTSLKLMIIIAHCSSTRKHSLSKHRVKGYLNSRGPAAKSPISQSRLCNACNEQNDKCVMNKMEPPISLCDPA